jgi:ISXO2-like transposase domain
MFPTLYELHNNFFSEEACIDFLFQNNVLYKHFTCSHCHTPMTRYYTKWRCPKKSCHQKKSIFKDTLFFQCNLPCNSVLLIGYLWLTKSTSSIIQKITGHSTSTITRIISLFKQLVASDLEEQTLGEGCMIGGKGVVVEIDESKFFNPHTDNQNINAKLGWVFGGIERTEEKRLFVEYVQDRSADTLLSIIHKRVHPESIILSDCWMAYENIQSQLGIQHLKVNHSQSFVDPLTGAHTNTIEGTWHGLKLAIPQRERSESKINGYLLEFIWRQKNKGHEWESLLQCLCNIAFI